jgi:hypothetical protein
MKKLTLFDKCRVLATCWMIAILFPVEAGIFLFSISSIDLGPASYPRDIGAIYAGVKLLELERDW